MITRFLWQGMDRNLRLSVLLILGDDLRTFVNDLLQTWFPATPTP